MNLINPVNGEEIIWRGQLTTSPVTENALHSVAPFSSVEEGLAATTEGIDDIVMTAEKITGTNNLKSISLLEKMLQASRSVAHITIPGIGVATGFMISPDILITNHHVFRSPGDASEAIIRFNYQMDLSGIFLPTDDFTCDVSFFHTNKDLDYSVVKVNGAPGTKWGYLRLTPGELIDVPSDVFIIQHPAGEHKQVAISDNVVAYADDTIVQYLTDTMPGSSGAPVFNDSMRVVALHHSGGWIPEPSTNSTHYRNEGINISSILKDMPRLS